MQPVDPIKMRHLEMMARELFNVLDSFTHGELKSHQVGMALFIFSFKGAELTYISNADRGDMFKMLTEFMNANAPPLTWDEQHG